MIASTSEPKMETGFEPGDSSNLPRMDCLIVAAYLVTLPKHDGNAKTSKSSKECYGDDAIGYVQLRRDDGLCTLKAIVCPQPEVYANITLTLNEIENEVLNIQCHGCEGDSGCMHGAAFLLWLHRRSEEPDFRHRECYWRKPWMAQPVKFITTKQLSKTKRLPKFKRNPADPAVLNEFLAEAKKRNVDGRLIRDVGDGGSGSILTLCPVQGRSPEIMEPGPSTRVTLPPPVSPPTLEHTTTRAPDLQSTPRRSPRCRRNTRREPPMTQDASRRALIRISEWRANIEEQNSDTLKKLLQEMKEIKEILRLRSVGHPTDGE